MAKINVYNLNRKRRADVRGIKRFASFAVKKLFKKSDTYFNIVLLTDSGITRLNKQFKKVNRATDVLCFCLTPSPSCGGRGRGQMRADIYISLDRAAVNARRYKTAYGREVLIYTAHGLLHAAGMRDATVRARAAMYRKQDELIRDYEK